MIRLGIFFGGQSREREISFASGRTVYDNVDRSLFTPIPIFIDSLGNFILLHWSNIYKGTTRDFYPPAEKIDNSFKKWQLYIESLDGLSSKKQQTYIEPIGKKLHPHELRDHLDVAFIALHGSYGEDGTLQSLLDWYQIPYTGSGIFHSSFAIDKIVQRELTQEYGFLSIPALTISSDTWESGERKQIQKQMISTLGLPFVIKSPKQGSSIGVYIVKDDLFSSFEKAVNDAFFRKSIEKETWLSASSENRKLQIIDLISIKSGLGIPIKLLVNGKIYHHPRDIQNAIEDHFKNSNQPCEVQANDSPTEIIVEKYTEGKEFSCLVLQTESGQPVACLPTEIIKYGTVFDYKSKYLAGKSRKQTPIQLPDENIRKIQSECIAFFKKFRFDTYLRIDGFFTQKEEVYLIDPNTISGMLPASFFFHQAAEIGLAPTQLLSYIVLISLKARQSDCKNVFHTHSLYQKLKNYLTQKTLREVDKIKVAVVFGGISSERHISVESGRNIYQKLSTSKKYAPVPVFFTQKENQFYFFQIPIALLFKDNADDIFQLIEKYEQPGNEQPIIQETIQKGVVITDYFYKAAPPKLRQLFIEELKQEIQFVFIALHGRPGEDGQLQELLQTYQIPFNGSDAASCQLSIQKNLTNQILKKNGFCVPQHWVLAKQDWLSEKQKCIEKIESEFSYPLIAKPTDDGCSSAVQYIENEQKLKAYMEVLFRNKPLLEYSKELTLLGVSASEEFPLKNEVMIESYVRRGKAKRMLEITCGLVTKLENGKVKYQVFLPSEVIAQKGILSLEEKFLAGIGENITPAQFSADKRKNKMYLKEVQSQIQKAAQLLNIKGYARIDAFVKIYEPEVKVIFIEVNALPGMTPATCIFHQAALSGYTPYQLIAHIIEEGLRR